jgi:rod shape-determining protein MreC
MSRSDRLSSPFPPDIPIGVVTRVDEPGTDNQLPHVQPFANLRRLEFVDVLTKQINGNRPKGATP